MTTNNHIKDIDIKVNLFLAKQIVKTTSLFLPIPIIMYYTSGYSLSLNFMLCMLGLGYFTALLALVNAMLTKYDYLPASKHDESDLYE